MEFWYFKRSLFSWGKKKYYEDNFEGFDILNSSKENEWPKGLCVIIIGMNVQSLWCHTRLSLSRKEQYSCKEWCRHDLASEFLFHFVCRLFPSGLKAREPPLYGTWTCENCRLWIGPRNPIKTSIHRLCVYQMVSTVFLKTVFAFLTFKNHAIIHLKTMQLYWL